MGGVSQVRFRFSPWAHDSSGFLLVPTPQRSTWANESEASYVILSAAAPASAREGLGESVHPAALEKEKPVLWAWRFRTVSPGV